jgi:16S rRNA processing protein RimM
MTEEFQIGAITQTHGIKGEVKVFPTTDEPARFQKLKKVTLKTPKQTMELEIAAVRFFKQYVILKFKGIDNINDVEKYKGATLWVPREQAIPLKKDEYFVADLLGLTAVTTKGEDLGIITDVLQTGANDVYVIEKENKDPLYVPAIKDCVKEVDVKEGRMRLQLLPGLLELNQKGEKA